MNNKIKYKLSLVSLIILVCLISVRPLKITANNDLSSDMDDRTSFGDNHGYWEIPFGEQLNHDLSSNLLNGYLWTDSFVPNFSGPYAINHNQFERTENFKLGNGVIDLAIDANFPEDYHQYILDLFSDVYAPAVAIYGPPAFSRTVIVKHVDGGGAAYGSNRIYLSRSPEIDIPYDPNNANDPNFDSTFIHELLHGFHDPIYTYPWGEEGMASAGTYLISQYLGDEGIRNVYGSPAFSLRNYDLRNNAGAPILICRPSSWWSILYNQGLSIFWILMTSESTTNSGSWLDYDFLKRLNSRLMDHPHPPLETFISMINKEAPFSVDGMNAGNWVAHQPITSVAVPDGAYLGVYSSNSVIQPNSFMGIYVFTTNWIDGYCDSDLSEDIEYQIYDVKGDIFHTGEINISGGFGWIEIPTADWPAGGYKIEVSGEIKSETLTASNYFFVSNTSIESIDDGFPLVKTLKNGELSLQEISSSNNSFLFNSNAGAILLPSETVNLPLEVKISSQEYSGLTINIPLPFTRVIDTNFRSNQDHQIYLPAVIDTQQPHNEWPIPSIGNLVPNPSFELGLSQPDGWRPPNTSGASQHWEQNIAHAGEHSLELSDFLAHRAVEWQTKDFIPVVPGKIYKASVWVKGTGYTVYPYMGVSFYDGDGNRFTGLGITLRYSADIWTNRSYSMLISNPDIKYVKIQLGTQAEFDDPGAIWFDDVYFGTHP